MGQISLDPVKDRMHKMFHGGRRPAQGWIGNGRERNGDTMSLDACPSPSVPITNDCRIEDNGNATAVESGKESIKKAEQGDRPAPYSTMGPATPGGHRPGKAYRSLSMQSPSVDDLDATGLDGDRFQKQDWQSSSITFLNGHGTPPSLAQIGPGASDSITSLLVSKAEPKFEIESKECFSSLVHKRLRLKCHRSADRTLAECYNSVARASIDIAYDLFSSHIERGKALAKSFEECKNRMELERINHNTASHQQWLDLVADKEKAVGNLRLQQDKDTERVSQKNKTEIANLKNEASDLQRRIEAYETDIASKAQTIASLEASVQEKEADFQRKADREKQASETSKRRALDSLRQAHQGKIAQLTRQHDGEMRQKDDALRQSQYDLNQATRSANEKLEQVLLNHAAAVQKLNDEFDEKEKSSAITISQMQQDHRESMQQLQRDRDTAIATEKRTSERALKRLTDEHESATKKIYNDRQELNAALLTRDNEKYQGALFQTHGLPRKTDDQIRSNFGAIMQLVEDLGRQTLKKDHVSWSEQLTLDVGKHQNSREIKRAVVQDAIWKTLFEHVFISPFRILGDAGRVLEQQWADHCSEKSSSKDYHDSPVPSIAAERWRYFTMKGVRDALTAKLSQFDPRFELKKGFKNGQINLATDIKAALDGIVELTPDDAEKIDRLSKQVFPLWLDFSMHRCRIVVLMHGNQHQSTTDEADNGNARSLTLTLQPTLGRYGNVQGLELESFKPIDGCNGESITIP